ncbi:MAG TPA: tetratricopeptide repeat protein [Gemmatimonadaceae bacterium]|nr:tetratricopeptide repeat protein [Gemmatimonadaceae bacterium]
MHRSQINSCGILLVVLSLTSVVRSSAQQPQCPSRRLAGQSVERGWTAYRAGDVARAETEFKHALSLCPGDAGALTGAGYASMRRGQLPRAREYFSLAIAADSGSYDAAAGAGMAAYRAGDLMAARRSFERALAIVPGDSTAKSYIAKLPAQVAEVAPQHHARPATTIVSAKAGKRIFEIPDRVGHWSPMWIKAVNLGAALPGKYPSEFPPADGTYEKWIALIAGMGANTIRVYTIHPPHFYAALRNWNLAHPAHPIWLIHGVWAELPPGKKQEKYDDPKWLGDFRSEMRSVVSLLHGDALIAASPGHASGAYSADVSQWTLGYIIGREWEPYSVVAYNASHPGRTSFAGKFIGITRGNPLEVWLAEQCDYLASYEMAQYNAQRPIAYTNWPTLDPLVHPTETTRAKEVALLKARGEAILEMPKEYDNDSVSLDAVKMTPTAAYPAGVFASYHVYPYYPDFLNVDPTYSKARSPEGPSNYFGYLRELMTHHGEMPVVISEFGVPSSRGIGHFQAQGWNHGGLTEEQQASIDARLTRDIYASGAAGAGLFSLIDEWFKKNWIVVDFETPADRKRLWLNPLDAEENYGVVAMRAGRKDSVIVIDGDTADWRGRPVWYSSPRNTPGAGRPLALKSLRVAYDEAYVYLQLEVGGIDWSKAHYQIGIDTYRKDLGDANLPHTGSHSPVGLEFVLDIGGPHDTQLLVDHPYNPYRGVPIPGSKPLAIQYIYNKAVGSVANTAGVYDSLVVVPNRRRIGRDGHIYPAVSYDRNRLLYARQSETSLADWFANQATGVIEVRLPWGMLQVLDPSARSVLSRINAMSEGVGVPTDGFRFIVESYDPAKPGSGGDKLPRAKSSSGFAEPPLWTWPGWETPQWHAELKPVFSAMQRAFDGIPEHPAPR